MKSLIIDRPDLLTLKQKYANNVIKLIFVLAWLYILVPFITLLVWYVAYTFLDQHIILLEGYKEYKTETSFWYLIIVFSFALAMILWSSANLYFNNKKNNTEKAVSLSVKESCEYFKVPIEQVTNFRKSKNITVFFDDNGQIIEIKDSLSGTNSEG